MGQQLITETTYSWVPEEGVTSFTVECWGAGANGQPAGAMGNGGAGGGGGAYAIQHFSPYDGETEYDIGIGTAGATGGDTMFTSMAGMSIHVLAKGASYNNGGLASASTGLTKFDGGDGYAPDIGNEYGGGGGSSAGMNHDGYDATNQGGASTPTGNPSSGAGANGGAPGNAGASATNYGAGGGGAGYPSTTFGTGSNGVCRISWGPTIHNDVMTGGVTVGGTSGVDTSLTSTGGVTVGGTSDITAEYILESIGGVTVEGYASGEHNIISTGGMTVGVTSDVTVDYVLESIGGVAVGQAKYANGYKFRTGIVVPAGKISDDLEKFPLMVRLRVNGLVDDDFIFETENGERIYHDLRSLEDGLIIAVIKVDLFADENNVFFCYYG